MISDNPNAVNRKIPRRATDKEGAWWSDSQKLECVKTYLMTGNLALSASMLKIPEETVRRWRQTTWWNDIVSDLRDQDELVLSARLQKIVGNTLDVVEDRLQHGDFVFDQKTGKMRRKPVNMRDAHKVGLDLQSRRDVLVNRHSEGASEEQTADKLLKLANRFAELAGARKREENTIEAEVVPVKDAEHEIHSDHPQDGAGEMVQENQTTHPGYDGSDRTNG